MSGSPSQATNGARRSETPTVPMLAVTIPTRNRPEKLRKCLAALEQARRYVDFLAYACDSSDTEEMRAQVEATVAEFDFARYSYHTGKNASAARNHCARVAEAELLISVDDDVYVEPEAIPILLERYFQESGPRVLAGSLLWLGEWGQAVVLARSGTGRPVREGEEPSFLVSALVLYPRNLALTLPWNDHLRWSDDRFMGALWRSRGVKLIFEPRARAIHDEERRNGALQDYADHIYTNMFDSLMGSPNLKNSLTYEGIGLAGALVKVARGPVEALRIVKYWAIGHMRLFKDRAFLRRLLQVELPKPPESDRFPHVLEDLKAGSRLSSR